jgi:S1-C subfamily serine protease
MNPQGSSIAPASLSAAPARRRGSAFVTAIVAGGALALGIAVATTLVFVRHRAPKVDAASQAVARVVLGGHAGAGFFVAGPDGFAYLVTANHVVDGGEPILVEHVIDGPKEEPFVEAYPDTDVVAFDADADLAVIRLNGVGAEHFPTLRLAAQPVADEPIVSYGFPDSSLAKLSRPMSKPGKVLSLVKFPVHDHGSGQVLRKDAIDGLLVSSDIEPGFSGGPTLDAGGEVVGVNVTKDLAHRGQNGAVSVSLVKRLIDSIHPRSQERAPTSDEVQGLLQSIQREYLMLPVERRWAARQQDYVSPSDLPRAEKLMAAMHRLESDRSRDDRTKLTGEALLGVALARLPGQPLQTYLDRATRSALSDCERREKALQPFFGKLTPNDSAGPLALDDGDAGVGRCSALAFRPLVWDLTALALRWEGKEKAVSVSRVEEVDPQKHVYRAQAKLDGIDYLVDVWLATDGGRLRLKLFDADGQIAGLALVQATPASAFSGTWHRHQPRAAHEFAPNVEADMETQEDLTISIETDGTATLTHRVGRAVYPGAQRWCGKQRLSLGLEQSFSGPLQEGSIVAFREKDARPVGEDMAGRCGQLMTYAPDRVAVVKRIGSRLVMYRTDGTSFPESAEFER